MKEKSDDYYLSEFDYNNSTDLDNVKRFYYENPSNYVVFGRNKKPSPYNYIGLRRKSDDTLVAITSYEILTDNLVKMWSTVVRKDLRGLGLGNIINQQMEEMLQFIGYGKIASHIYVENLPSIFLKLKRGYIIEGTLMDHDAEGQHEYVLGKMLK
jgi:RimJ/RimL family protein N-acetyltransferase